MVKRRIGIFTVLSVGWNRRVHPKLRNHPYVIPVLGLFAGFFIVAGVVVASGGQTYGPSDSHVVHITVGNNEQVVPTRVKTVGELVDKLKIDVIPQDIIEPSRDSVIDEDNFQVNVYRARPVLVIDGANRVRTLSAEKSPRLVAVKAGISVFPEDEATFSQGSIKDNIIGEKVEIVRAVSVNFNLYGTPLLMHTRSATVADLLEEKNVLTLAGDTVTPEVHTPITPGMSVFVVHNGKQVATVEEAIPPPVDYEYDATLYTGQNITRDPGAPGKKAVTYELTIENGKETARRVIQEVTISAPIRQLVARGTKPRAAVIVGDKAAIMAAAGISPGDYTYVDYIIGRESGWCATKWQGQVGYCPPTYEQIHSISSGFGYGLCQSTPAIKMASAGADWPTNPVTQMRWCSNYAHSRYGSWGAAYNHWLSSHNW